MRNQFRPIASPKRVQSRPQPIALQVFQQKKRIQKQARLQRLGQARAVKGLTSEQILSLSVEELGYDEQTQTIVAQFVSDGSRYSWTGVPKSTWEDVKNGRYKPKHYGYYGENGPSIGAALYWLVIIKYPGKKLSKGSHGK